MKTSLSITRVETPKEKYALKCTYPMTPEGLTVHDTANDASAMAEISYMLSNNDWTSFHLAVDDTRAVQGLPLDRNGWHAGDGPSGFGNRKTIGIEVCYSKSGGERYMKARQNGAELCAILCKQYGWDVSKIKKHQDRSGKVCPHRNISLGWAAFIAMVQAELDKLNGVSTTITGQRLIFPVNRLRATASASIINPSNPNSDPYFRKYGFYHYGQDIVSETGSTTVYAMGKGKVIDCGWDNILGNVVIIRYDDCINAKGVKKNIISRQTHFKSVSVKKNDTVTKDTTVGIMGNTGSTVGMAVHLHIELDTDTNYPYHSPTVWSSNFVKGRALNANALTMVPISEWLHCKVSAPDNQTFSFANNEYVRQSDRIFKEVTSTLA